MNIIIISPGKSKDYLSENMVQAYTARISHYANIEWKFIPTSDPKQEGEKTIKSIPENSFIILMDDKGKMYNSISFSEFIDKKMGEGIKNLVFLIGGAYGFSEEVREYVKSKQNLILSLSTLTFPHELVRGILAEQLYRAFSIIKGEKYHHE